MIFMNEDEIDEALYIVKYHGFIEYLPYVKYLSDWRDIVNQNSDGWAYWKAGSQCAAKLQDLVMKLVSYIRHGSTRSGPGIENEPPPIKDFERALTPIKSCATRHKFAAPRPFGTGQKPEKPREVQDIENVMEVIHSALRNAQQDARINDVTSEGTEENPQIILTVDTGEDPYQVWAISKDGVRRVE